MDKVALVNIVEKPFDEDGFECIELKDMGTPELPDVARILDEPEEEPHLSPHTSVMSYGTNGTGALAVTANPPKRLGESGKRPKSPEDPVDSGFSAPLILCTLVACMGGVLGGFSHGFPSPTLLELHQAFLNGDTITAFPQSSFYTGLFGVS